MAIHCFYDVETTGLDSTNNDILQLGMVIRQGHEQMRKTICMSMRPYNLASVQDQALEVTGFSRERIAHWPDPTIQYNDLIDTLSEVVDKYDPKDKIYLIGYNNHRFDDGFMRQWAKKAGDKYGFGSFFWRETIDVLDLFDLAVATGRLERLPNRKLVTVSEALNVKLDKAHDALEDVLATVAIYDIVAPLLSLELV